MEFSLKIMDSVFTMMTFAVNILNSVFKMMGFCRLCVTGGPQLAAKKQAEIRKVSKNEGFCINTKEHFINNKKCCIKNEEFVFKMMNLGGTEDPGSATGPPNTIFRRIVLGERCWTGAGGRGRGREGGGGGAAGGGGHGEGRH